MLEDTNSLDAAQFISSTPGVEKFFSVRIYIKKKLVLISFSMLINSV